VLLGVHSKESFNRLLAVATVPAPMTDLGRSVEPRSRSRDGLSTRPQAAAAMDRQFAMLRPSDVAYIIRS